MRKIYALCIVMCIIGCSTQNDTEKHQKRDKNIISLNDSLKEIVIKDVLINNFARICIADKYLIISDGKAFDESVHIFKKDNFEYVKSFARKGRGPGEVVGISNIQYDKNSRSIYVNDTGKQTILKYNIDSLIEMGFYLPSIKLRTAKTIFPTNYKYFNDTLSIGVFVELIGTSQFNNIVSRWDMNTSEITPLPYIHPDIKKKRISTTASLKHGIIVETYDHHDLMTIYDIDGNLKYNIYGEKWDTKVSNKICYYWWKVEICKDYIIVPFSGNANFVDDRFPKKFLIFNTDGDYIKTLDLGVKIVDFCYDEDNNRLILGLNDIKQFAYLDLNGVI